LQGGRPVQDAFYRVLCPATTSAATGGGPAEDGVEALDSAYSQDSSGISGGEARAGAAAEFFGALRDRMVRAERALPAFQALFWERARELDTACLQRGLAPTVAGVEAACARGRAGRALAGSHAREVMLLLQQLCEGHNRQMQDFLRQQGPGSSDLVSQVLPHPMRYEHISLQNAPHASSAAQYFDEHPHTRTRTHMRTHTHTHMHTHTHVIGSQAIGREEVLGLWQMKEFRFVRLLGLK
jgi:hypothetical protein